MRRVALVGVFSFLSLAFACGAPEPRIPPGSAIAAPLPRAVLASGNLQQDAKLFLEFYNRALVDMTAELQDSEWKASTDVSDAHAGERVGAEQVMAGFTGSAYVVARAKALLAHATELDDLTVRQLRVILLDAAGAPATDRALLGRRIAAEAKQSATQDGYVYCLQRQGTRCVKTATANDIDDVLRSSVDLGVRENAWRASKDIGKPLRAGILDLRDLRNATSKQLGYSDFYALQVADYGMTTDEMMKLLDDSLAELRPLLTQLQCYARKTLAKRYKQKEPTLLPAHWIGNRWAQSWPGIVDSVNLDKLFTSKPPAYFPEQAEKYYVSMGFDPLPKSFWEGSDLYPVKKGDARHKNSHASAWHMDLENNVRSLMSVEPNEDWFLTAHHELGHIYYYLSYAIESVPPVLRRGANRAFHEGVGELISLSVRQEPYLRQVGLLGASDKLDPTNMLLDDALSKGPVFFAFSAGTMAHYEHDLYSANLPATELNARWWKYVAEFQGVAPPSQRDESTCDACSKTHINDDPGQYYDYALATLIKHQLHEHFCKDIVHADPHACTYYQNKQVGDALRKILALGDTRDWRAVLREVTGEDISVNAMARYYAPLIEVLKKENAGKTCGF